MGLEGGRRQGSRRVETLPSWFRASMSFCNYLFSLQLVCVDVQEESSIWIEQGSRSASLAACHIL